MSILVDPRERVPVGLDAQPMPQNPDIALVESEMRILTSSAVLRRVAEAQNLADDPEFRPGLVGLPLDSLTSLWRAPAADPDARLEAVVEALGNRISVKRGERNYIVDVEVRAATPDKAEHLAQGLADAFFAEQAALSDRSSPSSRRGSTHASTICSRASKPPSVARRTIAKPMRSS